MIFHFIMSFMVIIYLIIHPSFMYSMFQCQLNEMKYYVTNMELLLEVHIHYRIMLIQLFYHI